MRASVPSSPSSDGFKPGDPLTFWSKSPPAKVFCGFCSAVYPSGIDVRQSEDSEPFYLPFSDHFIFHSLDAASPRPVASDRQHDRLVGYITELSNNIGAIAESIARLEQSVDRLEQQFKHLCGHGDDGNRQN